MFRIPPGDDPERYVRLGGEFVLRDELPGTFGFFTVSRWVEARELRSGDRFVTASMAPGDFGPGAVYGWRDFDHWRNTDGDGRCAIDKRGEHCGTYWPDDMVPLTDDGPTR